MSGCVELQSSMTGSTRAGPLKPPVNSAPLTANKTFSSSSSSSLSSSTLSPIYTDSSSSLYRLDNEPTILTSPSRQQKTRMRHKMTPVRPSSGQPIQLTPLWEHVVRTRRFPSEVDTHETFGEITERLRDPEWEVRQHALRVLVDVLPTLDFGIVDDAMIPVLPELINNLGHSAPAVRKGALDTLRVYLVCSRRKEDIVRGILDDGLSRTDTLDNFQTNVALGVILSVPSLLFPSSSSPRPSEQILHHAISALAMRLIQVTHQEAAVRSLVKVHELLGDEEFNFYLNQLDMNAKRDYEVLCDVYKIRPSEKNSRKECGKRKKREKDQIQADQQKLEKHECEKVKDDFEKNCDCRNDCGTNEKEERLIDLLMQPARIVLETEIKFNEETAITMTILEQKDKESDEESDFESGDEFSKEPEADVALETEDDPEKDKDHDGELNKEEVKDEWIERRKTPRRVHFGGEIVKLRTPDSDDSELVHSEILQTRIPIPISPTSKIPAIKSRKSRSNPCSPNVVRSKFRKSQSVSNSPKREFYTHDASLSPKKSILTRNSNNTAGMIVRTNEESKRNMEDRVDKLFGKEENDSGWAFEIYDNDDFMDSSLEKIDPVKNSTSMKNNRKFTKKRRNSVKANNEGMGNNVIGKSEMNERLEMIDQNVSDIFGDAIIEKNEPMKNSTGANKNRELPRKRRNSLKTGMGNNENDKIQMNERSIMVDKNSDNVFGDSILDKVDTTKNSTSVKTNRDLPRKRRNSIKTNNEEMGNNEIDKIEVMEKVEKKVENLKTFDGHSEMNFLDSSVEKMGTEKTSKSMKNNRESSKTRLNSAKTNGEVTANNEISKIEVNERVEVVSVELVKGSQITLESSSVAFQDKQSRAEEPRGSRNSNERISLMEKETREVEEKLVESTNERNVKFFSSVDSQRRLSPRSPKKLVFETFPRKERNYILMELSSPVKTNSRRNSENQDDETYDNNKQHLLTPENNLSNPHGYSPIDSSANRSMINRDDKSTEKIENSQFSTNSIDIENSTLEQLNEKNDKNKVTFGEIEEMKKNENFDVEPNPLPDIIITETTRFRESNWEELGLVDQEVLNDLHNKDDWRARVRGLERVASALRTSSALIAIESRLGSLLQAVLGGERSCRVAAAGMAVARVVVAGVSEDALKRRLPQVAWGLARQGGPNAAQLARVAMLRLRPALLLEQLLQPHCIKARNAKTRENALQLLIFSLVTFPSTEFKVENVAYKVATMVSDRRRRVRQAALDTLAVLAQIYEPEEVTKAGKLAAKGQQDGDAMLAAIRARLARKSLPMVSADGLVVYGLQISPTVQIATGPDVDWIVAGSGSVSPGTGRTRGQIIATTTRQGVQEKNAKNKSVRNSLSTKGPNFVALGVGLETKNEQQKPFAWQLVQHSAQDETRNQEKWSVENRNENSGGKRIVEKSRLTGTLRQYRSASERLDDSFVSDDTVPVFLLDDKDVIMKQRKTEENFHRRMDEIYAERTGIVPTSQDVTGNRLESRIPVPQSRDRELNGKEMRFGTSYPRRGQPQEGNHLQNWSAGSRVSDISRPHSTQRDDQTRTDMNPQRYQTVGTDSSPHRLSPTRDTYRSIYRQYRGYADGNVYREVQTAPTTTTYDVTRRRQSLRDSSRLVPDSRRIISSKEAQTTIMNDDTRSTVRRVGKDDLYDLGNSTFRNGDKSTVEEEEYNEINRRNFSVQANSYQIQNSNERSAQCPDQMNNGHLENWSNTSSNASVEDGRGEIFEKLHDDRKSSGESFGPDHDHVTRASPAKSPMIEKSFDVITHEINPSRRNSIDYGISSRNVHTSTVAYTSEAENEEYETDKDSSLEETTVLPRVPSSQENFADTRIYEIDSSEIEESSNRDIDRNIGTAYVTTMTNDSNSSDGGISKVSDDSPASNEDRREIDVETLHSSTSPTRVNTLYAIRSIEAVGFEKSRSSTDENDEPDAPYIHEYSQSVSIQNSLKEVSPRVDVDSPILGETFSQRSHEQRDDEKNGSSGNIVPVLVGSRPHSRDPRDYDDEVSFQPLDFRQTARRDESAIGSSIVTKILENENARSPGGKHADSPKKSSFNEQLASEDEIVTRDFSRDSANSGKINRSSSTGNENPIKLPEVNGAQASTSEKNEAQKRVGVSRVPRIRQKTRTNIVRVAPMPASQINEKNTTKSKPVIQQCFTQLESNDWETAIKGLKGLSQIAKQQPEQLDSFAPGTIGRLLGRHVRNLRSQVSRAACLAAGDVFGSQARCIDQDLDDIAGPLLHRTADTNKFLRADSNEALDRMVENLPPNKTIGVIIHRGGTHQNAIVRATTARLLASIVDRVGPDWTMSLPRDSREKLIATGAKLLMDGNLDARNHAKKIFRKLSRCEGFRKALKDSVPETTLRHIDKTLKSL